MQNGGCNVEWQTHGTRRSADHEGSVSMLPSLRIEPLFILHSPHASLYPQTRLNQGYRASMKRRQKSERRGQTFDFFFFQRVVRNTS